MIQHLIAAIGRRGFPIEQPGQVRSGGNGAAAAEGHPAPAPTPIQPPGQSRSSGEPPSAARQPAPAGDALDVGICPRCDRRVFHLSAHIPTCSGRPGVGEPARELNRCDEPGCDWKGPTIRSLEEHRRRSHRSNPRSKPPLELPPRVDQAVGE